MYFSDATKIKNGWANELLHEFECNVEMLKQAVKDHDVGSPPKSPTHASPQHTQTGILPLTTLCHSPDINWVCVCVWVCVYVHHMVFSVNKYGVYLMSKKPVPHSDHRLLDQSTF